MQLQRGGGPDVAFRAYLLTAIRRLHVDRARVNQRLQVTDDLDALRSATAPTGVRLLPPRDPYTQLRDRATIVDEAHHREVWRAQGGPGTVLIDGEIAGTWRPRKRGQRLTITVEPFAPLSARDRERLEDEAERIGPLRGASSVDVGYGSQ